MESSERAPEGGLRQHLYRSPRPGSTCIPRPPPVVPNRFVSVGRHGAGCEEGPVIPNLRRYDWRCRVFGSNL